MNCVWCERPIRSRDDRTLEEPNPDSARTMVGMVHGKCLAVFRALMREALAHARMKPEEASDRLEFLESLCSHGPWKAHIDSTSTLQAYRCIKCGAPADHQLEPEDLLE